MKMEQTECSEIKLNSDAGELPRKGRKFEIKKNSLMVSPSSSSSVGPMANATDVLQPKRGLLHSPYPPPRV